MAEIRVEQKRGGLGWLWALIAIIVIALIVWWVLHSRTTDTAPVNTAPAAPGTTSLAPAPASAVMAMLPGDRVLLRG